MLILLGLSGCGGAAPPRHGHQRVVIRRFEFEPATLTIAAGDTVEWLNQDLVPHTVTARSGRWDSGPIAPKASWRIVPTFAGNEPYQCVLHPTMRALVEVRP